MKKISRKTVKALEKIAITASYSIECRGGTDERNNDSEDFPEISIRALQEMLREKDKGDIHTATQLPAHMIVQ